MDNNDILIRLALCAGHQGRGYGGSVPFGWTRIDEGSRAERCSRIQRKDEATDAAGRSCTVRTMINWLAIMRHLESFLNGLITSQRGKPQVKPGEPEPKPEFVLNNGNVNNMLLKKVKIALTLTNEDMLEILESAGVKVSKSELSAVLRKEGHRNYKPCGDRYARNFLKGLALRYRG